MDVDNWDLQAVVRGCCLTRPPTDPFSSFPPLLLNEEQVVLDEGKDILFASSDILDTETSFHELEDLCKPFFLKPQQQSLLSPQRIGSPSSSPAAPKSCQTDQQQPGLPQRPVLTNTPRSKRRKNQQKRVVCYVPADGLHSDQWAWRKYGQKPIKGSPYPRYIYIYMLYYYILHLFNLFLVMLKDSNLINWRESRGYYRCSSSKVCLARKQVERSRTNPAMLVVTYTAEHNHPVPTHRNSLAGSTRQKLPPPPPPAATSPSASSSGADGDQMLHSSPPSSYVKDELLWQRKGEEEEDEEKLTAGDMEMVGEEEDMLFLGEEALVGRTGVGAANSPALSDYYAGEGGFAEHFFASTWLANNNAAAAADGS